MKSQKGREITIVFKLTGDAYPAWIGENHLRNDNTLGVHIHTIYEGDAVKELDRALDEIEEKDLWKDEE